MEFTIERERWYRGHGSEWSRLLRSDGQMCCLGFYARACGISEGAIYNVGNPLGLKLPPDARWLSESEYGRDCRELIRLNDAEELIEDREGRIAEVFAKHGVTVRFQ